VIKDAQALIKKYETQQGKVRNNREYDAITKEIEFQNLEIQLAEKRIKEYKANILAKKDVIDASEEDYKDRQKDLKIKKKELDDIVAETEKEEAALIKKSKTSESIIEERLLNAYKRLRSNVVNGLGVVTVERDACGGCFNKIPPQRHLDIKMHKKVIVCEHCGRILVDADILTGKAERV
jgi:predicted  nucleic acid-binding Zn-ribbon protein